MGVIKECGMGKDELVREALADMVPPTWSGKITPFLVLKVLECWNSEESLI